MFFFALWSFPAVVTCPHTCSLNPIHFFGVSFSARIHERTAAARPQCARVLSSTKPSTKPSTGTLPEGSRTQSFLQRNVCPATAGRWPVLASRTHGPPKLLTFGVSRCGVGGTHQPVKF